jgi:capsular polysaccharide transport system ATP-binding protein
VAYLGDDLLLNPRPQMIELRNLSKTFFLNGRRKTVADKINAVFPTGSSVAILGRNGAGKSTLLSMIAGTILPDSGEIISDGAISWPVGFAGSFHPDLTGRQNTYFIARVYGIDTDELAKFVEEFAELGVHFNLPIRSYSSGMRSRLAFGVSMGIPFDTYLVDEVTAVGDASFRRKSEALFLDRMQNGSSVVVTHSMQQVRRLCNLACILENGVLTVYEDVDEAIAIHEKNMKKPHPSRAR